MSLSRLLPLILASIPAGVNACSCMGGIPPCQAYGDAVAVFSGVVTDTSSATFGGEAGGRSVHSKVLVRLEVEKAYSGVSSKEVEITTGMGGGDCGYSFRIGERYLIYAHEDPEAKKLATSICSLTKPLAAAKDDLAFIQNLASALPGSHLYGQVLDSTRDSSGIARPQGLAGAKVRVAGPGGSIETITDRDGKYDLSGLPPGHYRIGGSFPKYIGSFSKDMEVNIRDRGCARIDVMMQSNGQLSGRVIDAEGKPVAKQYVELVAAEKGVTPEFSTLSDEQGVYELTGVRPGDFYLGVNLSAPPNAEHPYPRTYYPDIHEREKAPAIHLDRAEKLTGRDIHLPARSEFRALQGIVLWPNGTPASNATIALAYPDYPGRSDMKPPSDSQGRFSFQVLSGVPCYLWVQAPNGAGIWMNAGKVEVPTQGDIKPMVLILGHEPPRPSR